MHPHPALFNLGEKMERLNNRTQWMGRNMKAFPYLCTIWLLYEIWMDDSPKFKAWIDGNKHDSRPRGLPSCAVNERAQSSQYDGGAPQDSVFYAGYNINANTDDDDDGGKVEDFEESWSNLRERVGTWRKSILLGLPPAIKNSRTRTPSKEL
jgi:hypothetical protein